MRAGLRVSWMGARWAVKSPRTEAVPLITVRQEQDGKMGWETH